MKRIDLIRHLEANGCLLLREGGSHSVYEQNEILATGQPTTGSYDQVPMCTRLISP
jgi:predicted RNA binding protein YcfA (HicA-like mRNA interferase family)